MLMYLVKKVSNATIFTQLHAQLHVTEESEVHEITVTQS